LWWGSTMNRIRILILLTSMLYFEYDGWWFAYAYFTLAFCFDFLQYFSQDRFRDSWCGRGENEMFYCDKVEKGVIITPNFTFKVIMNKKKERRFTTHNQYRHEIGGRNNKK
jgi:Na+-transporting NADH:ubiquinone oxidoreductase subunit NqrF